MEIKLTDEQIEQYVQKTIEKYVMDRAKQKVDKVIKEKFTSFQNLETEMRKAIQDIMREKIEKSMSDGDVSRFMDTEQISREVSDAVLGEVADNISRAIQSTFY